MMTRTSCLIALLALTLGSACQTQEIYVGPATMKVEFDGVDVRPSGPTLGWVGGAEGKPFGFVELRLLDDSEVDVDATEILFGVRSVPIGNGVFSVSAQGDLGVANVDVAGFQNSNSLVSLGVAGRGTIWLGKHLGLYGSVGFRYYVDTTSPTTCNDGTTSSSVGSGTCSHHGGIAHYNDYIGDGGGTEVSFGLLWAL